MTQEENEERPCLHCWMMEVIDEFYAEHPAFTDEPNAIDTDEVVEATAKIIAEFTSAQNASARQQIIETLMQQIMSYDKEFREQDSTGVSSVARH